MKYQDALVAWTPGTDRVRVGPIGAQARWADYPYHYAFTGGAAYTALRTCKSAAERDMMMFIEFHTIVVRDRVPVEAAHRAFLEIDEYRDRISPDIEGATPGGGGWGV